MNKNNIIAELQSLNDEDYKKFQAALIPVVPKEKVIGVRIPQLRGLAKRLKGTKSGNDFLENLPHTYFDENNLHAFLIEQIKDFDTCLLETERFLPYIDNWATCDSFNPPVFKRNTDKLLPKIYEWLESEHTYTVRYGIKLLMSYFLDEQFDKKYLETVAQIESEEYYIKMMQAWYFATALAKQYEDTVIYLENKLLPTWIHNKTIQKATESYRIDNKTIEFLKSLRI